MSWGEINCTHQRLLFVLWSTTICGRVTLIMLIRQRMWLYLLVVAKSRVWACNVSNQWELIVTYWPVSLNYLMGRCGDDVLNRVWDLYRSYQRDLDIRSSEFCVLFWTYLTNLPFFSGNRGQACRLKRSWRGISKGIQRPLAKRWVACNPVIVVKFGSPVLSWVLHLCAREFLH